MPLQADEPESLAPATRDEEADFVPPGHEEHDRLLILSMLERTSTQRLQCMESFLNDFQVLRRARVR